MCEKWNTGEHWWWGQWRWAVQSWQNDSWWKIMTWVWVWKQPKNTHDIKQLNGFICIHENKENQLSECYLIHNILKSSKRTKNIHIQVDRNLRTFKSQYPLHHSRHYHCRYLLIRFSIHGLINNGDPIY